MIQDIIDKVNFRINLGGEDLAIAVVQDFNNCDILMVAFMNSESLEKTLATGRMTYYSTSRKKLWIKGESSGHFQVVKEVYIDCDGDALLFKVDQKNAACHEGYFSCFFRKLENGELKIVGKRLFDPKEIYGS